MTLTDHTRLLLLFSFCLFLSLSSFVRASEIVYANNNSVEVLYGFLSCPVFNDPDIGFGYVGSESQGGDIRQYLEFDIPSPLSIGNVQLSLRSWEGSTTSYVKVVSIQETTACTPAFYSDLASGTTYFNGNVTIGNEEIVSFPSNLITPGSKVKLGVSSSSHPFQYNYVNVRVLIHPPGDMDGDNIPDGDDNCPDISNPDQLDTDSDTIGNACDGDDDNDGTEDTNDQCPLDPSGIADYDGDGMCNTSDTDDDNDGIDDINDNCILRSNSNQENYDGDNWGDKCDEDDDNDGITDILDAFPLNEAAHDDADNDGFVDSWNESCDTQCQSTSGLTQDNCPAINNPSQQDTDGDLLGDSCDNDDDNDGTNDSEDQCPLDPTGIIDTDLDGNCDISDSDDDNDGIEDLQDNCPLNANADQTDTDTDSLGDSCDSDDDNDGVDDSNDQCPLDPTGIIDTDLDGICNASDTDDDNDSIKDLQDNCPLVINANQENNDGDSLGDACDSDMDNDSIDNTIDRHPTDSSRWLADSNILYNFYGKGSVERFGHSVSGIGDVNNDSYDDLIVGAPWGKYTRVISGHNGKAIYEITGYSQTGRGVSDTGDINNDGYDDFAISGVFDDPEGAGGARVFSGLDGSVLYTFPSQAAAYDNPISGAGDVNNDGYNDVIIGSALENYAQYTNAGYARVYSGKDGSLLYSYKGGKTRDYAGFSVSEAGDINKDNYDDFIITMSIKDSVGQGNGLVIAYSGQDGSEIYKLNLYGSITSTKNFGNVIDSLGDVNNDSYPDLIIGAKQNFANGTQSGSAWIISGENGQVLYTYHGNTYERFGSSVSKVGDLNQDGYAEFAIGAENSAVNGEGSGYMRIYNGADGTILYHFEGSAGSFLGSKASYAGDVNNDGLPDLIVGAPSANSPVTTSTGMAVVYSGAGLLLDSDADSMNDAFDTDDDNDGIEDFYDPFPQVADDFDSDGINDMFDWDMDNDGTVNTVDADPLNAGNSNEVILPIDSTFAGEIQKLSEQ